MSLKDMMAADVAAIFLNTSELADTILYNGKAIPAIIEFGVDPGKGNTFTDTGQAARAVFGIASEDVKMPATCDIIQIVEYVFINHTMPVNILEIDWQVARILESGGGMHRVECTTDESAVIWK